MPKRNIINSRDLYLIFMIQVESCLWLTRMYKILKQKTRDWHALIFVHD